MERLTVRNSEGIGVLKQPFECERCGDLQWSLPDLGSGSPIDRLAGYEDLVERLGAVYGDGEEFFKDVLEHIVKSLELHEGVELPEPVHKARLLTDNEVDRWEEFKRLEGEGKLPKLPCAVGDTVYTNCSMHGWYFKKKDRPYKAMVVYIGINGLDNYINVEFKSGYMLQFKFSDIGKTVFLTKEEAEAALKELEGKEE